MTLPGIQQLGQSIQGASKAKADPGGVPPEYAKFFPNGLAGAGVDWEELRKIAKSNGQLGSWLAANNIDINAKAWDAAQAREKQDREGPPEAWKSMETAGQNAITGRYGLMQEELSDDLWGRGFGRSGLMAEGLGSLAGRERMDVEGLRSDIANKKQNYGNTIMGLQQQEGDLQKSIADRKKGLKYQAIGSGLGLAGNMLTGVLF